MIVQVGTAGTAGRRPDLPGTRVGRSGVGSDKRAGRRRRAQPDTVSLLQESNTASGGLNQSP